MIKVLMIGNHPSNKGGMTSVISQIREHDWHADGIELSFVPTFIPGNPIKKIIFFLFSYIRILARFIVAKPDIVHMHMSYKGSFTRKYAIHRLCRTFGVRDIIHLHGSEFEKWYSETDSSKKAKIRRLMSECDSFIVLGEEWKRVAETIEPSVKATVISNGIPIPDETVRWNDERCQLLFLGVLIPRKGVADLISAVKKISDEGQIGNLQFVIAGTGEEEENLRKQVSDASLEDCVAFAGWVAGETKTALIMDSQIMVSPSYNEGLPISILEAAAFGMPIVSTDVGDISSVVRDHVNGILFEAGDIDALADAVQYVSSRPIFERMSAESRNIAESSFSIEGFYDKLLDLYRTVGEKNG